MKDQPASTLWRVHDINTLTSRLYKVPRQRKQAVEGLLFCFDTGVMKGDRGASDK